MTTTRTDVLSSSGLRWRYKRLKRVLLLLSLASLAQGNAPAVGGITSSVTLPIIGGSLTLHRGVRSYPPPSAVPLPYGPDRPVYAWRVERISFYQAVPEQTNEEPHISACGPNLGPWIQVAVSRDLLPAFRCRSLIRIELDRPINGIEWFDAIVYDTMHPRFRNTVDVMVNLWEPAMEYGVTTGTVYY